MEFYVRKKYIQVKHILHRISMLAKSEAEKIESWIKEMRKGYIKLVVLMFLNEEAMSGYDIMKRIEEATLAFGG